MQSQDFNISDQQSGTLDGGKHFRQRGNVTAGENVFGDPRVGDARSFRPTDGVQHHHAVVGEQFRAALEVGVVVIDPDMFEHADRDDALEGAGRIAIVLQAEFRTVGQILFPGARIGDAQLFFRQGNTGHLRAGHLRQIKAHAAPSAADVEHALIRLDQQLGGEVALLGELGVVERRIRRLEVRAAVLHVGVEEEAIEPPVEIVVTGDVALRPRSRVELLEVAEKITQAPLEFGPARREVGLAERDFKQIRDRPFVHDKGAFGVKLAQRQFRIEQQVTLGFRGQEPGRNRLARPVAAREAGAGRRRERHRAAFEKLAQEELQQTIHRTHVQRPRLVRLL